MPGSVKIMSTGMRASSTASTRETMITSDPSNPHPMALQPPVEMGKDCGCEYRERPSAGIDMTGVGNLACNDAACEQVNKHPSSMDLQQAGSIRGRK